MNERKLAPTDELALEIVYNTGRIALYGPDEHQIGDAIYTDDKVRSAERIAEAYVHTGPGLHIVDNDDILRAKESSFQTLAKHLPREAMRYGSMEEAGSSEKVTFVYFGNLAIRGRRAESQEVLESREEARVYREKLEQRRRAEIAAQDAEKTDYTKYDHAQLRVGQTDFFMKFDMSKSMLAARILQYVKDLPGGQLLYENDLQTHLWESMPLAERTALGIKEADVYSATPKPIISMTSPIIDQLANRLGLLTDVRQRTKQPVEITLHTIPNPDNYNGNALPIVPPGTPKRTLEMLRDETKGVPENVLEALRTQLTELIEQPAWDQKDAIDMLDIIMTAEGKVAIYQIHGKEGRDSSEQYAQSEEVLENLHKRVLRVLGEDAYYNARHQRTIGGNRLYASKVINVKQGSGDFKPSETKNEETVKQWTIGKPQTLKNRGFIVKPPL